MNLIINASTLFQFSKSSEILKTTFRNPWNLISKSNLKKFNFAFSGNWKISISKKFNSIENISFWQNGNTCCPSSLDCLWCHKLISKCQENKKWCWIPPLMRRFQKSFKKITKRSQSFHPKRRGPYCCITCGKGDFGHTRASHDNWVVNTFSLGRFFFLKVYFLENSSHFFLSEWIWKTY